MQNGETLKDHFFVSNNLTYSNISKKAKHLCYCRYSEEEEYSLNYFSSFHQLRSIKISSECFGDVCEFNLDGLKKLESVKIGNNCCKNLSWFPVGSCRIVNCPYLRDLDFGTASFTQHNCLQLSNLRSLKSIKFGMECFGDMGWCNLKGMINIDKKVI